MEIAWIGTGVMGRSMAGHLRRAGHGLRIYSRGRAKAQELEAAGARWYDNPAAAAAGAEVVFTMVGMPADVREVYFGVSGILAAVPLPRLLVDMTTSEPRLAMEIAAAATARGAAALDAPVSGGDSGARNANLAIMAGGDRTAFSQVLPVFELMGKNIRLMGGPGAGQHAKMCNQILIASTMVGVCESLLYASKAGLDEAGLIEIISKGAAGCWSLSNLGPRILAGDFAPGFFVEHFIKDMGIALAEAAAMKLALPGLAMARQLYLAVAAQGHGRLGTQALMLGLRQLNGLRA